MALNSTGIDYLSAALLPNLAYAQMHSASAGVTYLDNIAVASRVPVIWGTPSGGEFHLLSAITFLSGPPGGVAHSVTLWDSQIDGSCFGEFVLTGGDGVFNGQGEFQVTAIDFTITATDV